MPITDEAFINLPECSKSRLKDHTGYAFYLDSYAMVFDISDAIQGGVRWVK